MNHLIIAPVVLPAALAGLILLFARNSILAQRLIAGGGMLALVSIAIALIVQSSVGVPQAYFLGNWPAPFGIVLILDRLSALMLGLTAVLSAMVLFYVIATGWDKRGAQFHALLLFQVMGLNGAFLTGDAFNLFVFFEVLLIASYGLMVHGGQADRLRAGIQYVAINLIGSTLFLFGLATIYSVTGTLNMADLAIKIGALPIADAALIRVAAVMLLLVFAVKAALVPLHFWLPGTYANAPGPVAALFAVMTKVGAYAVIRFGTLVFGAPATAGLWADILQPAALATLALGAIGILGSNHLSRAAAFAGIGSMGVVFLAIAANTPLATAAALYYILHSTFALAALFLLCDVILSARGQHDLTATSGLMAKSGLIAALFLVAAVAMAGMPPLSGFVGKLLVMDALRDAAPVMWSAILIASFLTILGFARAGSALFWKPTPQAIAPSDAPNLITLAMVAAPLATLVALTIFAGPVMDWLMIAAQDLHSPAPYIAANMLPKVAP